MSELWCARNIDTLFSATQIQERVRELGRQITQDHAGRELVVVCVLRGAFVFMADLVRSIDLPITCEFIGISSYGNDTESSGVVRVTHDLAHSIEGKDVLVIEDIIDTGLSIDYLLRNLRLRGPRSVRTCSLLDKQGRRQVNCPVDYVGFTIPDHFVVGYGLDVAQKFRNLPFIGIYHA